MTDPQHDGIDSFYRRTFNGKDWEHQLKSVLENVPIEASVANAVQKAIQDLADASSFDAFFPDVIISYSTGHRVGVDAESAGPGLVVAAGVIQYLFDKGCPCYTDLMTPAGKDWREYMLRLHKAKIMVVLVTKPFLLSVHCLREVAEAFEHGIEIIPVRIDETSVDGIDITRDVSNMWPDSELQKYAKQQANPARALRELELLRLFAREKLSKLSALPVRGTLLSDPNALDALVDRVSNILTSMEKWNTKDENDFGCQGCDRRPEQKSVDCTTPLPEPATESSDSSSSSSSLSGGFLVGVEFTGAFMDECVSWNEKVIRSKRQIESMLKKLLRFGELSSGEPELTVETISYDGVERGVAQLECEIDIHKDLESYEYKRVQEICRKIAALLKKAGATEDELHELMIGAAWKGSLYLLLAAPPSVFRKFLSLMTSSGSRLSLGVHGAVVVGLAPAFAIGGSWLRDTVSRQSLLASHQGEAGHWPDACTWRGLELTLLVPTSKYGFKKLVTNGMTRLEGESEQDWKSMASVHSMEEAPPQMVELVHALVKSDILEEPKISIPTVEALSISSSAFFNSVAMFQVAPLVRFDANGNPQPNPRPGYDVETESIAEAFKGVPKGFEVDVSTKIATVESLSTFARCGTSPILHFACHGHPTSVEVEDGWGATRELSVDKLREIMSCASGHLKVAFLSGRHSRVMGDAFLNAGVPHVVCCENDRTLDDATVFAFTRNFYRYLASRYTLTAAYQLAFESVRVASSIQHPSEELKKFQLLPLTSDGDPFHDVQVFFSKSVGKAKRTSASQGNNTLPPLPYPFVGREIDMYNLLNMVKEARIVEIEGEQGIGKSSFAKATCRHMHDRLYENRVLWIPPLESSTDDFSNEIRDLFDNLRYKDIRFEAHCESLAALLQNSPFLVIAIDGRDFKTLNEVKTFVNTLLLKTEKCFIWLRPACQKFPFRARFWVSKSITLGRLDVRSSLLLFGALSPLVSGGQLEGIRTPTDLADLLAPVQTDRAVQEGKVPSSTYFDIGRGSPTFIRARAAKLTKERFVEFVWLALLTIRPQLGGDLKQEISRLKTELDDSVRANNDPYMSQMIQVQIEQLQERDTELERLLPRDKDVPAEFTGLVEIKRKLDEIEKVIASFSKTNQA